MTDYNPHLLRLLDEAERVLLADAGDRYTRLREAVNQARQSIGLGPLTETVPEYPIRISRREFMDLPLETRRKITMRMTNTFMDALAEKEDQTNDGKAG